MVQPVSGLPQELDIEIYQDDDFSFDIQITEDDEETPIDLTGTSWSAQIRETPGGSTLTESFTIVTDDVNGMLTLSLTAAETAGLSDSRRYAWDLYESAEKVTWLRGTVTVTKDVTRL